MFYYRGPETIAASQGVAMTTTPHHLVRFLRGTLTPSDYCGPNAPPVPHVSTSILAQRDLKRSHHDALTPEDGDKSISSTSFMEDGSQQDQDPRAVTIYSSMDHTYSVGLSAQWFLDMVPPERMKIQHPPNAPLCALTVLMLSAVVLQ